MNMLDFTHFNAAFPTDGPTPYDPTFARQIETFRKSFDGVLFIDRVLRALGIKDPSKTYPPHSPAALRSLHNQIITSSPHISPHARLSVLFYLLLDFDEKRGPRHSNLALSLAEESGLPPTTKSSCAVFGIWTAPNDIITVLVKHAATKKSSSSSSSGVGGVGGEEDDYSLPLAYYHTVQPVLKTSESLELLFGALARTSVTEALYFSRKWPEQARRGLFERLVGSVVDNGGEGVGGRARELVSLPLEGVEEEWFNEFVGGREKNNQGGGGEECEGCEADEGGGDGEGVGAGGG
ncbi:nuclear pore complex assembly-domain-containing protein [Apiosordaria backusii]|uniref:Nuclear pore complex assembly-domain-containing protein n=1 Tax=Apiosordaria backusii TaxID=314023 RepID=A0AA40ASZ1_9PEZI|nr:nuclear pore complex assembly-domain-containing protein [Apiosordaria backusii]